MSTFFQVKTFKWISILFICSIAGFYTYENLKKPSIAIQSESFPTHEEQQLLKKYLPSSASLSNLRLEYSLRSMGVISSNKSEIKIWKARIIRYVSPDFEGSDGSELWLADEIDFPRDSTLSVKEQNSILAHAKQGALVHRSSSGQITNIEGSAFWKGLLGKVSISKPSESEKSSLKWQTSEKVSYGLVNVRYEMSRADHILDNEPSYPDKFSYSAEKFAQAYFLLQEIDDYPQPQLRVTQSCDGTVSEDIVLLSLSCEQSLIFLHQKNLTIQNEWETKLISVRNLTAEDYDVIRKFQKMIKQSDSKGRDHAIHNQQLAGQSLDDFIDGLFAESIETRSEKLQAYLNLKAWIYLNPDKLDQIYQLIKARPEDGTLFRNSLRALMGVGSEESQMLMTQLLDDNISSDIERSRSIIGAMALLKKPSPNTEKHLQNLVDTTNSSDIKRSGMLAIAAMGNQLKGQSDPESQQRSQNIEQQLNRKLDEAQTSSEIREVLSYLGNLASANSLQVIEPYTRHQSSEIRKTALFSLRLIQSEKAEDILWLSLEDHSEDVRSQVVRALGYRPRKSEDLERYQSWLKRELSAKVRRAIVRQVISFNDIDKAKVAAILESHLDNEDDSSIRQIIENSRLPLAG